MTDLKSENPNETKNLNPFIKKRLSPFVSDPYNTRGKKGGKKGGIVSKDSGKSAHHSINVKKFKGGSGGDR